MTSNVSIRFLVDQYLGHGLPVIVEDGAKDWPILELDYIIKVGTRQNKTRKLKKNIFLSLQAYKEDDSGWGICSWMGNTRPFEELEDFFELVERFPPEKSWFAHW